MYNQLFNQHNITTNNMKTFEIYKNGTHHANIQAKNIKQATEMYAAAIGDYNFNIYEEEEDEEEDN